MPASIGTSASEDSPLVPVAQPPPVDPLKSPAGVLGSGLVDKFFIDLKWLSDQPLLPFLCQTIPAVRLHASLRKQGFEDHIEIIEHLKGPILRSLVSLDTWKVSSDGPELSFAHLIDWIEGWLQVSPEFAAARMFDLDDETLLLWWNTLIEIFPVDVPNSQLVVDLEDHYAKTPDNRYAWRPRETDGEAEAMLTLLMRAFYNHHNELASSVLGHACMELKSEIFESARHFREAQLADLGLVTQEVALPDFRYLSTAKCQKVLEPKPVAEAWKMPVDYDTPEWVRLQLEQGNPDETAQLVLSVLGEADAVRLLGSTDLRPETIVDDPEVLDATAQSIVGQCLLIWERTQSKAVTQAMLGSAQEELEFDSLCRLVAKHKPESLLALEQSIYHLCQKILAVDYQNRLTEHSLTESARAVRGLVNLGIGWEKEQNLVPLEVPLWQHLLDKGPSWFFRLGLSWVQEEIREIFRTIEGIVPGKWTAYYEMQKILALKTLLNQLSLKLDQSHLVVLDGLSHRIPRFAEGLLMAPAYVTKTQSHFRFFESAEDISVLRHFRSSLELALNSMEAPL